MLPHSVDAVETKGKVMVTVEHITAMLTLGLQKKTAEVKELVEAIRLRLYRKSNDATEAIVRHKDVLEEEDRVRDGLKAISRCLDWKVRADFRVDYNNLTYAPTPRDNPYRNKTGESVDFMIVCEAEKIVHDGDRPRFSIPKRLTLKPGHPYCKLVKAWRIEHEEAIGLASRMQRLDAATRNIPLTAQSLHLHIVSPDDHSKLSSMIDDLIESI